ncbi:MAG: DUF4384 domain-containing protein [Nitrospirota bacterium]|nr:DUF4384 domain-containing protein [Nitrospirota bacterium]MDH5699839.1 DUF4384 domain-containing protein [Nitrospirota bacterium]
MFPGSGHAAFLDKALDFGKDLLAKAAINYTNKYEQQLGQLLQSLRQPGVGNQPFIQGITPGNPYNPNAVGGQNPYDPNAPYGTTDPNYGNQYGGNQYGQNPGYDQGMQQGGYGGQTPGSSYPSDPNYGGYPSGDPNAYSQGQGSYDPYNSNQGYPSGGGYGQNQGAYPTDPNYGAYPQTGQQGGGYGQYPNQGYPQGQPYGQNLNQGYPADAGYGNYPSGNPNQYGQAQGGYPPNNPNIGSSGYPASPYPQQGGQDPSYQYGGGGYPGQPAPPSPQGGYDPYQPQVTSPPPLQQPAYAQPATPQYPSNPSVQAPTPPAIQLVEGLQLDVALVKKTFVNGAETLLPIQDGDILKDGRGNAKAGDKFRIMFRANTDCYVYVIAIDGSAWAQGIFPSLTSPFANPVKKGQQYVIPDNNNWFSLDQFKGIETVFFVASPDKRQDIEDILASIGGRERHPAATPQQVTEAPIIPAGFHRRQQSTTPFTLGQDSSSDQGLMPTTYFTQKAGEALRVTRWFRHE